MLLLQLARYMGIETENQLIFITPFLLQLARYMSVKKAYPIGQAFFS